MCFFFMFFFYVFFYVFFLCQILNYFFNKALSQSKSRFLKFIIKVSVYSDSCNTKESEKSKIFMSKFLNIICTLNNPKMNLDALYKEDKMKFLIGQLE
jgi:hypothetical protein